MDKDEPVLTDRLESSERGVRDTGEPKKSTREDDIVSKVERVKRMQQLYNSGKAREHGKGKWWVACDVLIR